MHFFAGTFERTVGPGGVLPLPASMVPDGDWAAATAWAFPEEARCFGVAPVSADILLARAAADGVTLVPIELSVKDGALHLSDPIVEALGDKEVTLVGVFDHIELWPTPLWLADVEEMTPQRLSQLLEDLSIDP